MQSRFRDRHWYSDLSIMDLCKIETLHFQRKLPGPRENLSISMYNLKNLSDVEVEQKSLKNLHKMENMTHSEIKKVKISPIFGK